MKSNRSRGPSRPQLLAAIEDLCARLAEAEQTLRAIREGDVDAIVVSGSQGEQVFSLTGAEYVYRLIVETMKEGALTVSTEGRILFCNDQFRRLVKESPARIVGRPLTDFVMADQKDTAAALLRKSRRCPVQQRLVFQDTGGLAVPAHVSLHILNQPDGSSICIVATDLTALEASTETLRQLRRQQEALLASEARYRSLAENLPSVLMRYDRDLRVVYLSPLGEKVTGVPVARFLGRTNREVGMPQDLCDLWENAIEEVFRAGRNKDLEFEFPAAEGPRTFYLKLAPEFDSDGAVDHVLGISTEITERKRAEEEVRRTNDRLRLLLNALPVGVTIAEDPECRVISTNPAGARLFEAPEGGNVSASSPQPPPHRYFHQGRELRPEEMPVQMAVFGNREVSNMEIQAHLASGRRWTGLASATPLRAQDGKVIGGIAVVRDITERKHAEEKIQQQNAILEGINRIFEKALTCETEEDLGRTCLAVAEEITGSKFGFLGQMNAEGRLNDIAISDPGWKACRMVDPAGHRAPPGSFKIHGLYGRVLQDGKGFFTNDPASHPESIGLPRGHPPLQAFLGVPLVHEGRTVGTIAVGNRPGGYSATELEALEALTPAIMEAFLRQRVEAALRRAHDGLQAQSEALAAANEELQARSEELRVQAEQSQESEQRLRMALDAGAMGHWEWNLQRDSVSWCARSCELLRLDPVAPATRECFLRCVHPDDRGTMERLGTRMLVEPADFQVDFRIVHYEGNARGAIVWLSSRGKVIRDAEGRGVRMIGVLYDITQRKEMEEQLRRMNDQLEEEVVAQTEELRDSIDRLQDEVVRRVLAEGKLRKRSQMLEAFFQHTITPLAFLDKHFNFVRVNEAYAQAEGQTPDYFVKKNYFALHPDEESQTIFEQVVQTRQPYYAYARPFRRPEPGWGVAYRNWQLTPLLDERGQVQFLVFNLEDVTERQKAFQELEQRARQLQKLTLELSEAEDRERRRLAEILHDDLQQQLAAAKFHLGILTGHVKGDETLQQIAEQIDQMLKDAIAKSRSLSHELSPAALHQNDLGETFEWLARQVQAKHGLTVHVEVRGRIDSPSDALKAFLYKAAQELLFNVVKHARTKESRLRLQRVRGRLWLTIGDQGQGFEPQTLSKTAGFGLFSIRERVELLGGRMKIKSARGRGSTFLIAVPDSPAPVAPGITGPGEAESTVEGAAQKDAAKASGASCLRVLLVDDHEVVREGLASLLGEHRDIEIVGQAGNGREAVDLACTLRPDVVIMDAAMPVMPGDEATRLIKQRMPETRVVALSMFEEPEVAEKMRGAGAQIFLLKTAPADDLLAAIRGGRKRE